MNANEFSKFYHKYLNKIYRFVYLRVNSFENARDITSQIFFKFWQSSQKNELQNPNAFIYRLARNQIIDFYRQKERQNISLENLKTTPVEFIISDDLEEKITSNLEINNIKNAMTLISGSYSEIIIWHYLDDLSIKEIADILNKKEATVRVLLHRALSSLKDKVKQE